jgi:hypothetical protein
MPQRDTSGIGERIPRELIDADFTVAFSLVEMAGESRRDNGQIASQLLQKAEGMLDDIRGRLLRMTASQKEAFEPRCAELGEAIERAKTPDSGNRT